MDFSRIEEFGVEQLLELIRELGEIAILTRELNAKSLMAALPGMKRKMALILVSAQKDTRSAVSDPVARALCQLLIRHQPTGSELTTLMGYCLDSEFGSQCFRRAVGYYYADPVAQGKSELTESLFLDGLEKQAKAEAGGTEYTDEQVEQDFEAVAKAQEQLRLREWLRDEYDIESPQDFYWMLDALRCVWKKQGTSFIRSSSNDLNQLTRQARRLYERAKSYPCAPSVVVAWDEAKRTGLKVNTVYKRPDGVEIWGDGKLVIRDKDGKMSRPTDTIFGKTMAEGTVPMDFELAGLVNRAYPTEEGLG